jgi:hypothetical protein
MAVSRIQTLVNGVGGGQPRWNIQLRHKVEKKYCQDRRASQISRRLAGFGAL